MRVERSQDSDFIADNEELNGEDFNEDADLADDDADLSDDDADFSDDDVEAEAAEPKVGEAGTNSCEPGTVAMSSADECESAAQVLGKRFVKHPKGCFLKGQKVFYNTHKTGRSNRKSTPLC